MAFAVETEQQLAHKEKIRKVYSEVGKVVVGQEYMVNRFGVKGADYTIDAKGNPALTEQGAANIPGTPGQNWGYMASAPNVSFSLDAPDFGRFGHDEQATYIAAGISDPCVGQFSTTDEAKGAQLNLMIFERMKEKTSLQWREIYRRNPDCAGEIMQTTQEALQHEQFIANGHVIELDDPRVSWLAAPFSGALLADLGRDAAIDHRQHHIFERVHARQ